MYMLANFLNPLARLVYFALTAYMYIVIARALISWVNPDPYNPIVRFLRQVTDPLLYRIRRVVPPLGGLDLSPVILILIIYFLRDFLVPTLQQFAVGLR